MKLSELLDRLNFSQTAIDKKSNKDADVKLIVRLPGKAIPVCLENIIEVGFDDDNAIIYIEVQQ